MASFSLLILKIIFTKNTKDQVMKLLKIMLLLNTNVIKMLFQKLFVMPKTNFEQKNFICQQTTVRKLEKI